MKKGTLCIIAGLLLVAAALFLVGYNIWDNARAGAAAQEVVEQLLPKIDPDPVPPQGRTHDRPGEIEYPDYILNPHMDMPAVNVDGSDYIGLISIPSAERVLPVFADWDYEKMKTGPCRYSGSVYLDNMVICAHNYVVQFGPLRYLSYGDDVTFTDMDGNVFYYKVMEVEILQPTEIEKMKTGDWDLTLFTCTLDGTTRVTVRCEKTEAE